MNSLFSLQVRFDLATNQFWINEIRIEQSEKRSMSWDYLLEKRRDLSKYIEWIKRQIALISPEAHNSLFSEWKAIDDAMKKGLKAHKRIDFDKSLNLFK